LDELLRRLRLSDSDAALVGRGRLSFRDGGTGAIVTLVTAEAELATAVGALGVDVRDALWPGATIEEAGFNILLVHLDEVLATRDVTEPLRITTSGLVWPTQLREL
jgi:hypothetical protein